MLKPHQAIISMSRKGNLYGNAACESFMKTLKYKEVYRTESNKDGLLVIFVSLHCGDAWLFQP
jgi:transposase InsO family protein